MKTQIIIIHGGDTFNSYEDYLAFLKKKKVNFERIKMKDWKANLETHLGPDYEVINLQMPNKANAKYLEWKIWFEKVAPFFDEEVILVGHSLGGIFLPKYLSENDFPKKILGTFLVAAPFDETNSAGYVLADFILQKDLSKFEKQGGAIHFYQSQDDAAVPFENVEKYREALLKAQVHTFEDKGHFNQAEFPELVKDIKDLK